MLKRCAIFSLILSLPLFILSCAEESLVSKNTDQIQASCSLGYQEVQSSFSLATSPQDFAGLQTTLIVQSGANSSKSYAYSFNEGISALDVLLASGIEVEAADFGFGLAVCAINCLGQASSNCFGDPNGNSWAFFYKSLTDTQWQVSTVGANDYILNDGDMIAFVWTQTDQNFNPLSRPDNSLVLSQYFDMSNVSEEHPENFNGIQSGLWIKSDSNSEADIFALNFNSEITAYDTLVASGLDLEILDNPVFGPAICSIEGVGQVSSDCFGDPDGKSWAFFYKSVTDMQWSLSNVGIGSYTIKDGDSIAMVWTDYDVNFNPILTPDNSIGLANIFMQ